VAAGQLFSPIHRRFGKFAIYKNTMKLRCARTDLSLGEVQRYCDLVPSQSGKVIRVAELLLKLTDLQLREGGSLLTGLRVQLL
jgi:hypothetical protein